MEEHIFENKKVNIKKLTDFGFIKSRDVYAYSKELLDGDFLFSITIMPPNIVKTQITESETGDIYTLHLTNAEGDFIGRIREEYKKTLSEISDFCFEADVFKFKQTLVVIDYVKAKYGDELEFLWKKFAGYAVVRRKDNKKWYMVFMTIPKNKLGINSDEIVEILNLRIDKNEQISYMKNSTCTTCPCNIHPYPIYPAYHMNKKSWITIILNNSVPTEKLYERIDNSYTLAKNNRH